MTAREQAITLIEDALRDAAALFPAPTRQADTRAAVRSALERLYGDGRAAVYYARILFYDVSGVPWSLLAQNVDALDEKGEAFKGLRAVLDAVLDYAEQLHPTGLALDAADLWRRIDNARRSRLYTNQSGQVTANIPYTVNGVTHRVQVTLSR